MIKTFPDCQNYMNWTLYNNQISWAKAYLPSQFNAGIQSTQSVESFNNIIKRSLNSASTFCDVEEAIEMRFLNPHATTSEPVGRIRPLKEAV